MSTGQVIADRIKARHRQRVQLRGEPDHAELAEASSKNGRAERQQRWLDDHHLALDEARSTILDHKDLASDKAYDSLLDIAGEPWTSAAMTLMTYAISDLSQSSAVAELPGDYPLHKALEARKVLVGSIAPPQDSVITLIATSKTRRSCRRLPAHEIRSEPAGC